MSVGMNADKSLIKIEVVYATADAQRLIVLQAHQGLTALQAFERSGLVRFFPELKQGELEFGIFSRPCAPETVLHDGDRVEIYRPLLCDPKEMRRLRAKQRS